MIKSEVPIEWEKIWNSEAYVVRDRLEIKRRCCGCSSTNFLTNHQFHSSTNFSRRRHRRRPIALPRCPPAVRRKPIARQLKPIARRPKPMALRRYPIGWPGDLYNQFPHSGQLKIPFSGSELGSEHPNNFGIYTKLIFFNSWVCDVTLLEVVQVWRTSG